MIAITRLLAGQLRAVFRRCLNKADSNATMLTFNADKHEYQLDGVATPSVTRVIGDIFPVWNCDPWYMTRGRAIRMPTTRSEETTARIRRSLCQAARSSHTRPDSGIRTTF